MTRRGFINVVQLDQASRFLKNRVRLFAVYPAIWPRLEFGLVQTSCFCRAELKWIWPGNGTAKEQRWLQTSNFIQSRGRSEKVCFAEEHNKMLESNSGWCSRSWIQFGTVRARRSKPGRATTVRHQARPVVLFIPKWMQGFKRGACLVMLRYCK